jgi:hypothetical protein
LISKNGRFSLGKNLLENWDEHYYGGSMLVSRDFNSKIARAKSFKIGKIVVPYWLIAVILVATIGSSVLGYYLTKVNVPLQVKDPIEIVNYPSGWSLYPGEMAKFNITVINHAPINYSAILDFQASDPVYQANYLTFSNTFYTIVPGQQNLEAQLNVAANAPAANVTVSISVSRLAVAGPTARVSSYASGPARGTTGFTPTTVTLPSIPVQGNLLIAVVGIVCSSTYVPSVTSITQTGVTWSRQVQAYNAPEYNDWWVVEIWAGVVGSGASTSVSIAWTGLGSSNTCIADICEYSGLVTSGFLDKTASNSCGTAKTNALDTGTTATTTQATELWIGGTFIQSTTDAQSLRSGSTFTFLDGTNNGLGSLAYYEKIVSTTGTADSGSTTANADWWIGAIATFIAS